MKVTLFQRNCPNLFSIENITKNIAENLPSKVKVYIYKIKYPNKGVINRIKSALEVTKHQGDINHITGDVHFLTYFLKKKKTILTIHDCEKLMGSDYGFIKKMIYKFFWFTLPKFRCKYITTISEESKKNLSKYAGINKNVVVIHDGVDPYFRVLNLTKKEKKELLDNNKNKKTVMHISGIQPNKNVPRLIKAIGKMGIKLIKVGKFSSYESSLLSKYNIDYYQFENIDIDLLVKIYNSVDCLVFPSLIEGFGLPVVEAQKCGCPVITSNISSMPEVGGKGAFYIDPYSVEGIKKGIKKVLEDNDLGNKIIKEGFKNAKRFEWENIARQYYKLYNKIK